MLALDTYSEIDSLSLHSSKMLTAPEPDVSFDLVACKICGSRYATEPMLRRIESVLPANLQKDSEGLEWIRVCPVCRRNIEAERATRQMVLGRSRKSP